MAGTTSCENENTLTKQLKALLSEKRRLEKQIATVEKRLLQHFTEEHRRTMAQFSPAKEVHVIRESAIPESIRQVIAQDCKPARFVIRDRYSRSHCQLRVGEEVFSVSYDDILRPGDLIPEARVRELRRNVENQMRRG